MVQSKPEMPWAQSDQRGHMARKSVLSIVIVVLSNFINAMAFAEDHPKSIEAADTIVGRNLDAPVNRKPPEDKFWWSDDWYDNGILEVPANYQVEKRDVSYINKLDGTDVPAILFQPKSEGKFPAVLFQHGRRGWMS